MIEIHSDLRVTPEAVDKVIVMEMEADDAFALATVLMNVEDVSMEWKIAFERVSRFLVLEGNKCH